MTNDETPCSLKRHISIQQIGAETLVYDERRHRAYCLNGSSSVIWRLADGAHTVAEIREAASVELKTRVSEEFVAYALEELRRDGLMEPSAVEEARPAISRRAVLQRLGVGSVLLLPAIASIVAPTAAQAYSGCVDCTSAPSNRAARARRLQQLRRSNSGISPIPSSPQK
jgi:hypothetical protein